MDPYQQNEDGSWSEAKPLGWLEEHSLLTRLIFKLRGVSHCGKKGWRS